jgi:hypothetical protein
MSVQKYGAAFMAACAVAGISAGCGATLPRPSTSGTTDKLAPSHPRPAVVRCRCRLPGTEWSAPFDQSFALEMATTVLDERYWLLNYDVGRGTCRPSLPAIDRDGNRGWARVDCTLEIVGLNGDGCDLANDRVGKCTGTIWQARTARGEDTHASHLRFNVILRRNQKTCWDVPAAKQLPPFAPRLATD